jgi:hypothetical protein
MSPNRSGAVAMAALALLASATLGVAAGAPTLPDDRGTGPTGAAATATVSGSVADTTNRRDGDGFTDCTNGTSPAMLACGYDPGPTAVELEAQETAGRSVTVRAVNLSGGGFVALHRRSFVDGEVTGSLVGVSGPLDPGLHTDVTVRLDEPLDGATTLVAVVYEDDGNGEFEFVSSDGRVDRPYTNTYSPATGNVTDEAGDVIGDVARVTVVDAPVVVDRPAADPDGDGLLEDVDGDGEVTIFDVQAFLEAFDGDVVGSNAARFDFDGDGDVDVFDVQTLLEAL